MNRLSRKLLLHFYKVAFGFLFGPNADTPVNGIGNRTYKNEKQYPNDPFFILYPFVVDGMNDKIDHECQLYKHQNDDRCYKAHHIAEEKLRRNIAMLLFHTKYFRKKCCKEINHKYGSRHKGQKGKYANNYFF